MASSPDPRAATTRTPGPDGTPLAAPSTTSTTSRGGGWPGSPASATGPSASRRRVAAPARSRHQPSGTEPTTLAASTTTSVG
jgi:hypothetical protein